MARNQIDRYLWLIDILKQRGRMTRRQINELWRLSKHSQTGEDMCRRTLYNYKNAIAELFGIHIECDPLTFEYYIDDTYGSSRGITEWLLNSSAVSEALSASRDISDRIILEDLPSARDFLPTVLSALRTRTSIRFDYHNYMRSRPTGGVVLEPYLARAFKQRWYVLGRNVKENRIKTYALDRMKNVTDTGDVFTEPDTFNPEEYFRHSFGIVVNESQPRDIVLRTNHHIAKYLYALPLHHSQQISVHDDYCLFRYRMRITDDLVQEILSQGSGMVVEEPRELRLRIRDELRKSMEAYDSAPTFSKTSRSRGGLPVTDIDSVVQTMKDNDKPLP